MKKALFQLVLKAQPNLKKLLFFVINKSGESKSFIELQVKPFLSRLTIRQKIGCGYALAVGIATLGTSTGLIVGGYYGQRTWEQLAQSQEKESLLSQLQVSALKVQKHQQQLAPLLSEPGNLEKEQAYLLKHIGQTKELLSQLKFLIFEETKFKQSPQKIAEFERWLQINESIVDAYSQQLELIFQQITTTDLSPEAIVTVRTLLWDFKYSEVALKFDTFSEDLTKLVEHSQQEEEAAVKTLKDIAELRTLIIIDSMLLSIALAAALAFFTSHAIAHPLKVATKIAQRITEEANFDLQVPVTTQDEVGQLTNSLNHLIQRVAEYTQELKQSEELYRTLANNFPNGAVFLFDHDLCYLIVEGSSLSELGFSKEEMEGKTIWEALSAETCEMIEPVYRAALAGVATVSEMIHKDNTYLVYTVPIKDEYGDILAGMVMTQNITPLKQTEEALLRIRKAVESASDAIGITDLRGVSSYHNQAFINLYGYTVDELNAAGSASVMFVNSKIAKQVFVAIRNRQSWLGEVELRTKSGVIVPTQLRVDCVLDDSDNQIGLIAVCTDITERKLVEAALAEQVRLATFRADVNSALTQSDSLRGILQRCTEAMVKHLKVALARIWTLNLEENLLELQASAGLCPQIDGDNNCLLVGQSEIGLIAQKRQPQLTNFFLDDPSMDHSEWVYQERINTFVGYPLIVEDQLVGVMAVFARATITESTLKALNFAGDEIALWIKRKQAEEALQQSEAQLRQQTTQLEQTVYKLQQTQIQLIQAEKMSSLGQMVAGVAHEFNNPVNFIHGNLQHAEEYIQGLLNLVELYQHQYPQPSSVIQTQIENIELEFLTSDLPKILDSMKMGTERIRQLVLSLRNFSRLDEAEVKEVDLHEGIDNTLLILNHRLKHGITVIRQYGSLPWIECYPAQLNQVFMNIINNAIDALLESAEQPNKEILIQTETIACHQIQVRIRDNGRGMPSGVKAKIFDPFFTTKPVGQGTGLGLSISYQIIQKHQGKIEVSSQPGQGTEFLITLPIKQALIPPSITADTTIAAATKA